jgi:hypothetical protein
MIFMLDTVQHGAQPIVLPPQTPGGQPEPGRVIELLDGASGILIRFVMSQAQADDFARQITQDAKQIITAPASMADAVRRGPQA